MFLRMRTGVFMINYSDDNIDNHKDSERFKQWINDADAILIGAGAGLSSAAGFTYSGKRFHRNFADFEDKYDFHDMYVGGFYPFENLEEFWAYWSRFIYINRYAGIVGEPYRNLLQIIKNKNYFVITTNVDHQFQLAGFDKQKLFYTQGDYGLFQCSKPCHNQTYDNEATVRAMLKGQKNMRIPSELVPHCPMCGRPLTVNLRIDSSFVEDEGWKSAENRYKNFLQAAKKSNILFLELGVGMNTPLIIKYPFWKMTQRNIYARYISVNLEKSQIPADIALRSLCLTTDIGNLLKNIVGP